mmetsp:Transcript_9040/g.33257  ORF Transcript_9040/g.33257 Transcript_9040/m.33257 type:complete len:149 (+) Transcript_9040:109-555(+)
MANAASGVSVSPACIEEFKVLAMKKTYKYIIYKIDGEVVVEKTKQNAANEEAAIKEQEAVFQEFCEELPESDCRYAVFDLLVETSDGRTFAKIFFIAWSPDGAKIKNKMLYASSKEKFKSMLPNIQLEVQACDLDDLELPNLMKRVSS